MGPHCWFAHIEIALVAMDYGLTWPMGISAVFRKTESPLAQVICLLWRLCKELAHDDVITWKHFFRVSGSLCGGYLPVTDEFPSQRPVTRSFDAFFDLRLNKWANNGDAGDLRHRAHYDVIVMDISRVKVCRWGFRGCKLLHVTVVTHACCF